jgi:hypothetical protein
MVLIFVFLLVPNSLPFNDRFKTDRSVKFFTDQERISTPFSCVLQCLSWTRTAARMDLLELTALERRIAELLGSPVHLLPEPVEKRRLQDQINRGRRRAF